MIRRLRSMLAGAAIVVMAWGGAPGASAAPLPAAPATPPTAQVAAPATRPTARSSASDQCQPASARWTATGGGIHSWPASAPIKASDLPAALNGGAAPSQTKSSTQCDPHSSMQNVAEAIAKAAQERAKTNKQFLAKGQKAKRITAGYTVVKSPATRAAKSNPRPMASGVYLKGMVTDAEDSPLTGIEVDVFDADMIWVGYTTTSAGNWSVEVDPGNYYVGFTDIGSGMNGSGWWSNSGFVYQEVDADALTVAGVDVTADVELPAALRVSGTIGGSGTLGNVMVWLLSETGGIAYDNEGIGGTDGSGEWSIAVAPGTYYVYMYENQNRYGDVFWTDGGPVYEITAAETVTVTSSGVTANLTLPDAMVIQGTIYDADGFEIGSDLSVYLWTLDGVLAYDTSTDYMSQFAVKVVPGSYIVGFFDDAMGRPTYASGYYTEAIGADGFTYYVATASPVVITTGSETLQPYLPYASMITGTITGASPTGSLDDIWVTAEGLDQGFDGDIESHGSYVEWAIPVAPGTYIISYYDMAPDPLYATGYYTSSGFTYDGRSASLITIAATDIGTRSLSLPKAPRIKGTVTEGGVGANDVVVFAEDVTASRTFRADTSDGAYTIPVAPGTYTLSFYSQTYASGYYSSTAAGNYVASQGQATAFSVTADTTRNVTLPPALEISGQVRDAGGWLQDMTVRLEQIDPDGYFSSTMTDSLGQYSFLVAPGTYRLAIDDESAAYLDGAHASGYYKDGASGNFGYDWASATEIVVTTTGVGVPNVTLPNALYIRGKVTRTKGVGLSNVEVAVMSADPYGSYVVGITDTSVDGTYSMGVAPGRYKIAFNDRTQTYGNGYYGETGFKWYWKDASVVTVQGSDRTGINVELPSGNRISGKITHGAGAPVFAYVDVSSDDGVFYDEAQTDEFGFYSLVVPPGTYTAYVSEGQTFGNGYFEKGATGNFTYDINNATPIAVTDENVLGIDVVLPVAVHIVGKVSRSGGAGVGGITVAAVLGYQVFRTRTSFDGTYAVPVPTGQFQLNFSDDNGKYGAGWLGSSGFTYDATKAANIQVTTADVVRNVTLPNAVHIKGKISRAGGTVPMAQVIAIGSQNTFYQMDNSDGTYSVAVPPGTYKLYFRDMWGIWAAGYYGSSGFQYRESRATSVTVSTADVTGKNVTLPQGKFIEGLVTNADGLGLDGIRVYASCPDFDNTTSTDLDGSYYIEAEASGCEIGFYDSSGQYATGYRGASGFTYFEKQAAKPTVTGTRLTGQDVTLPEAIYIKGTVRDGSANPLHYVSVDVGSTDGMYGNWAITDEAGKYSVEVAPDLSYDMFFSDLTGNNGRGYRVAAGTLVYYLVAADAVAVAESDVSPVDVTMNSASYLVFPSASYHAIEPRRILDTRPNNGAIVNMGLTGKFVSGTAREFAVAGAQYVGGGWSAAIPPNAVAITGNLTITAATATGTFTVGPTPTGLGDVRSISFARGETRANNVTVGLAPDGGLWAALLNAPAGASVDVVFDVTGYFLPNTVGATYTPVAPGRVLDSRSTSGGIINIGLKGKFTNGTVRTFNVAGVTPVGGSVALVPPGAAAVSGNLTVTNATSGGFLSVGPSMASVPSTSTLNTDRGINRANGVVVALNNGQLQAVWNGASGSSADVVFDVTGYFTNDDSGMLYHPIVPENAAALPAGTLTARTPTAFPIVSGGLSRVDPTAGGISGNLTVVSPAASGFAFISPNVVPVPASSTVNLERGQTVGNGVNVAASAGNVQVIWWSNPGTKTGMRLDITGYWK